MTLSKSLFSSLAIFVVMTTSSSLAAVTTSDMDDALLVGSSSHPNIHAFVRRAQAMMQPHRNLQTTDADVGAAAFDFVCAILQGAYEQGGEMTCSCDDTTNTLKCTSTEICENNECAKVSFEMDFTDTFEPDYMEMCVVYTGAAAEKYPDICVRATANWDAESEEQDVTLETCIVKLEKNGNLEECKTCEPCAVNGNEGLNLDCSNLFDNASTGGCSVGGMDATALTKSADAGTPTRIIQEKAAVTTIGDDGGKSAAMSSHVMTYMGLVLAVLGVCLM